MVTSQDDYLKLLDLTFRVANSLNGKPAPNHRIPDCNKLAQKLYYHAATVYWLNQGTNAPVPTPEGTHIFDFASVAVVTRAVLETYLTMYELFFLPITDDEQEFRHAYWLLSGYLIREKYINDHPNAKASLGNWLREIDELRFRIQKTLYFAALSKGTQKRCLDGDMPNKSFEKRLEAAGFAPKFTLRAQRYLSGYVHSDGLVADQIKKAKSEDEQKKYIRSYMHLIMMVMSKMIFLYKSKFPSAEAWCMAKPEILWLAEIWSDTTRKLHV